MITLIFTALIEKWKKTPKT